MAGPGHSNIKIYRIKLVSLPDSDSDIWSTRIGMVPDSKVGLIAANGELDFDVFQVLGHESIFFDIRLTSTAYARKY